MSETTEERLESLNETLDLRAQVLDQMDEMIKLRHEALDQQFDILTRCRRHLKNATRGAYFAMSIGTVLTVYEIYLIMELKG